MAGRTGRAVLVIGLGVLLLGVVLFDKTVFLSSHIGHIGVPPVYTDATMTAALIDGVTRYPDAAAQIGKSASGGPDLYVNDHVAFVGTLDPNQADSLCAVIADMYDPNSGFALPLTGAIVMYGGESVAVCGRH